jgi:hypothetical protein
MSQQIPYIVVVIGNSVMEFPNSETCIIRPFGSYCHEISMDVSNDWDIYAQLYLSELNN